MAIDLAALRAKMSARKLEENNNVTIQSEVKQEVAEVIQAPAIPEPIANISNPVTTQAENKTESLKTVSTSQIDHLDFLTKIDQFEQALIHTHPHMPVLLMKIHKQISADPELVTVLSEDQIGIIVAGLKVQTKTELTGTILKQSTSRTKKTKLDLDMF